MLRARFVIQITDNMAMNRQLLRSHHRTLRPRNPKRSRARESVRVFLLQSEEPGPGQCAGYGDSAGVVFGDVDGRGLFGYIGLVCLACGLGFSFI